MGKLTISMAIFNCYVSSPEGNGVYRLTHNWLTGASKPQTWEFDHQIHWESTGGLKLNNTQFESSLNRGKHIEKPWKTMFFFKSHHVTQKVSGKIWRNTREAGQLSKTDMILRFHLLSCLLTRTKHHDPEPVIVLTVRLPAWTMVDVSQFNIYDYICSICIHCCNTNHIFLNYLPNINDIIRHLRSKHANFLHRHLTDSQPERDVAGIAGCVIGLYGWRNDTLPKGVSSMESINW